MPAPLSTDPKIEARLNALKKDVLKGMTRQVDVRPWSVAKRQRARSTLQALWPVLVVATRLISLVALPFVMLVGGSVWLYSRAGWPTWLSLLLGIGLTGFVIAAYVARVTESLRGRVRFRYVMTRVGLPLVVIYSAYSLLYLSRGHAKSDEVRQYYTSVHPLLRLAISTATVFDREMVVTDMARVPADYDRMGLPRYENSLHFEQPDGYVHAVDLRTMRRSAWRNWFLRGYFAMMGFRTLRHVGTADHLHVSLPVSTP